LVGLVIGLCRIALLGAVLSYIALLLASKVAAFVIQPSNLVRIEVSVVRLIGTIIGASPRLVGLLTFIVATYTTYIVGFRLFLILYSTLVNILLAIL
jgi:hypothetical protein